MSLNDLHALLKSLPVPAPHQAQALIQALMSQPNQDVSQNQVAPDQFAWERPDNNGLGQHYGIVGQDNIGAYTEPGVASMGGNIPLFGQRVGGTLGVENGQPFGSWNMNGQIRGQFGPQGY